MSLPFIIAMAWKSAVIAGAALLMVSLLRSRAAADRAAILRLASAMLLLLPLVAMALPALQVTAPASVEPLTAVSQQALTPDATPAQELVASPAPAESAAPAVALAEAGSSVFSDWELLAALAYLAGLLAMGFRLAAGLLTLRRWTAKAEPVTDGVWLSALAKADSTGRNPRLLVSEDVSAPLSWGWRNPVILVDFDSLDRTEDAEAIIVHELAHVARQDWASLILARAAVALFWFNPLVWLMEREIVQQAEEAADSYALARVEPARYAQTLVTCAKHSNRSPLPANSIAASGSRLRRRVKAILEGKGRGTPSGSRWTFAAMIACVGFAAPVAALQLIPPAPPAAPAAFEPPMPAAPQAPPAPLAPLSAVMAAIAPAAPIPAPAPEAPAAQSTTTIYNSQDAEEEAAERAEEAAERAAEAAERAAERAERDAERAVRDAERIERDAERMVRDGERAAREGLRAAAKGRAAAAASMASGAKSMMSGADSMEQGARTMDEEAVKLRDRNYRELQIRKSAARGDHTTHEELIAAIPELQKGAREMREGAKEMRRGAEEMRRGAM